MRNLALKRYLDAVEAFFAVAVCGLAQSFGCGLAGRRSPIVIVPSNVYASVQHISFGALHATTVFVCEIPPATAPDSLPILVLRESTLKTKIGTLPP